MKTSILWILLLLCVVSTIINVYDYCIYKNKNKEMYEEIPPVESIPEIVHPRMQCPWKPLCLKCSK